MKIWEYVRGNRAYWKIQHDIVILGLRCDNHDAEQFPVCIDRGKFAVAWTYMNNCNYQRLLISIIQFNAVEMDWEMIARYPPVDHAQLKLRVDRLAQL